MYLILYRPYLISMEGTNAFHCKNYKNIEMNLFCDLIKGINLKTVGQNTNFSAFYTITGQAIFNVET